MCHVVVRTDRLFKWIRVRLGFITVARPTGKRKIVNMRGLVFVGHCFFEARYGLRREGCKLQGLIRSGMTSRFLCSLGSLQEWKHGGVEDRQSPPDRHGLFANEHDVLPFNEDFSPRAGGNSPVGLDCSIQ